MKRVMAGVFAAAVSFVPSFAYAQNPMMNAVKAQHDMAKGVLLKTAEKIPDNLYAWQPTPEVRTFAQLIGHVADASSMICGTAAGEKPAQMSAEKTMTTKAQLTKALADALAYCDKVIAGMDDTKGMETTKFFAGGMSTRAMVVAFNTTHNYEHYGNLVTYMRLNKIVPPSSEGQ
ncbi:MAG: DinB family protein [Acidobacteria bacterium]|nr:DinB family protein [Acidobacteriota bacterium]